MSGRPGAGVFGYRPPSSMKRMMAGDEEEPSEDLITDVDDEPTYRESITVGDLRRIVREVLSSVDRQRLGQGR